METEIAEQDLVRIAAELARSGKESFTASPACFLSTRSLEQAKMDVAYPNTNVELMDTSGGTNYEALGVSHHSAQDTTRVAPTLNMRTYLPSDRYQTACLVKALLRDEKPAYIRADRNTVEDVYEEEEISFVMDQANVLNR